MDFVIPEDLKQLKDTVGRFVAEEVIPCESRIEKDDRVPEELLAKMRDMGLFGITIPTEYGGAGVGPLGYALVSEEVGKAHSAIRALVGVNNGIGSKALVLFGTAAQKQKYLPPLAAGEMLSAFALSEPNAGSDVGGIETRAVRDGNAYILNGTKHFITMGADADVLTVMAATDPNKGTRGGLTAFLVDKGTPGFRPGRNIETMGGRGYKRSELIFDDCRVPAANVIGEVGKGFEVAMACLAEGRIFYAAFCVGTAQRLLDMSAEYAQQRVQFGQPIAQFQAIRFMLAEMATSIYAARMATYHAAWKCDRGDECVTEASMAKLFASEVAGKVADSAVQIHGAMGYAKDYAVERLYREARLYRIAEGTSEIQKLVIAKSILQ
jgi:acyl-CoA dehydrogenase